MKSAAAAAQATLTVDLYDEQRAADRAHRIRQADTARCVGAQIAMARRESPHRGFRHLGLAQALVEELPCADAIAAYLTLQRADEEQAHEPNETRPRGQLMADPLTERLTGRATGRDLITIQDETCRTPYCDAPIRHIDNITRFADGGETSYANGQGLCETRNYAKEHPDRRYAPTTRLHVPSPVAGPGSKTASRSTSTSGC